MPFGVGAHHRRSILLSLRGWATASIWRIDASQGRPLSPRPSLSRAMLADSGPKVLRVGRSPGVVRAVGEGGPS